MRLCTHWILPALAIAFLPSLADARGGPVPVEMQGILLVNQKPVQEDLKLTADQVAKVSKVFKDLRGASRDFKDLSDEEMLKKEQQLSKEADKKLAAILSKDQAKRLKQITFQLQGPFADPAVATKLKLTAEQKEKFKNLQAQAIKDLRKVFEKGAGGFNEMMKKELEKIAERSFTCKKTWLRPGWAPEFRRPSPVGLDELRVGSDPSWNSMAQAQSPCFLGPKEFRGLCFGHCQRYVVFVVLDALPVDAHNQ